MVTGGSMNMWDLLWWFDVVTAVIILALIIRARDEEGEK